MATMWRRVGTFLGLVEDYDDEYTDAAEDPDRTRDRAAADGSSARHEPSNVRRIAPARSSSGSAGGSTAGPAGSGGLAAPPIPVRPVQSGKVHLTDPTTFNEVEEVGEHFRNGIPVIMNLAGANESVAKRLLDFASGLIFGLDGRIERVGDRVFLLTPMGVEVSSEERRRLTERGFFNQA